jgi:hypothetical protein
MEKHVRRIFLVDANPTFLRVSTVLSGNWVLQYNKIIQAPFVLEGSAAEMLVTRRD